ncbi:lytic transglycosylase domain-containing protein [Novosphingobium olei]|uniref:lytic transglycosylase domain-containing protein n=1 Tax=Novosphingobium olei TaxID=2728851 RepID=UPI0030B904BC
MAILALALIVQDAQARGVQIQSFGTEKAIGFPFTVVGGADRPASDTPFGPQMAARLRDRAFAVPTMEWSTALNAEEPCSTSLPTPPTFLSRVARMRRASLSSILASIACEEGIAPALLDALVAQESRYNPVALSGRGAIGLTQLMPGTVRALGIANPWDFAQNLRGGARYLRRQLDAFGRYDLALAAYNAGPGQVTRHNGVPPFVETRAYVDNVLGMMLGSGTKSSPPLAYRPKRPGKLGTHAALVQQFLADGSVR